MHDIGFLRDLVVVMGAALVVVAGFRAVRLPSIAGFILAGAVVGPGGLSWVADAGHVSTLAEVGVMLLLFGVGIELSLERIRRLWRTVVIDGAMQVLATVGLVACVARGFGLDWGPALFAGCVIAVSSTAVVLRGLSRRGELESPHGRLAVGILVFQDLCVVPMILAIPFLSGDGDVVTGLWSLGRAALLIAAVLVGARFFVPRVLERAAATRERELFVVTVFLLCFGTAWAAHAAGVSLALGAFLAGLVVAGSEYRHQALADMIPSRELFVALFFISVGMLLDLGDFYLHAWTTLALLVATLVGKAILVLGVAKLSGATWRVSAMSALALCQVGEFSFVLLGAGGELLPPVLAHHLLVVTIVSMTVTPLVLEFAPALIARWSGWRELAHATPEQDVQGHAIVVGYGLAGRQVAEYFERIGLDYRIVDSNPDNVAATRKGVFGDATHGEILQALGVSRARIVVVCINDPRATESVVRRLRRLTEAPILARARFEDEASLLRQLGALVVSSEMASAERLRDRVAELLPEPIEPVARFGS